MYIDFVLAIKKCVYSFDSFLRCIYVHCVLSDVMCVRVYIAFCVVIWRMYTQWARVFCLSRHRPGGYCAKDLSLSSRGTHTSLEAIANYVVSLEGGTCIGFCQWHCELLGCEVTKSMTYQGHFSMLEVSDFVKVFWTGAEFCCSCDSPPGADTSSPFSSATQLLLSSLNNTTPPDLTTTLKSHHAARSPLNSFEYLS